MPAPAPSGMFCSSPSVKIFRERSREGGVAAGERAALARAFAEALPGNRRLGALEERVAALDARVEVAEARGEAAGVAVGEMRGRLASFDAEGGRGADAAEGVAAALRDLCEVQRARGGAYRRGLLARAAAFCAGQLRRADVAVIFLSRAILFDSGQARVSAAALPARNALAAALLLSVAELSWRAHRKFLRASPKTMAHVAQPFTQGLSLARAALWGSAFIIGAHHVKSLCYTVANEFFTNASAEEGREGSLPPGSENGEERTPPGTPSSARSGTPARSTPEGSDGRTPQSTRGNHSVTSPAPSPRPGLLGTRRTPTPSREAAAAPPR